MSLSKVFLYHKRLYWQVTDFHTDGKAVTEQPALTES